MRNRTRARGWALQALYAWEQRGGAPDLAVPVLHELFANLRVSPDNRPYSEILVRLVGINVERIDATIVEALTNWRLERLAVVDRAILRLGTAEMMFVDDVPPRLVIREMVQLAEKYGTHESARFVNGVLDAVMRKVAPGEATGA
ncbi:MAG TPA: transcription antitermination factor NusB [Longimicrobium sp.]|nr:transcription antitermination factor NusB [Longimicrobium sp.]HYW10961.1 transcription antitermination factor NusB [Longimicrobium sp.]